MDIAALADLTDEQRAAVEHPPDGPPLLLVAGAGTGKTTTLAARAAWLVGQGADPQRLLLITFSRRAAAEMAERAGRLLHRARGLGASVAPPRLPWCGTFHAVAARLLREEATAVGLPPGFSVLDRSDAQDLLALQRQQLDLDTVEGAARFPLPATCAAILSRCVDTRTPLADVLATAFPWYAAHQASLARLFDAYDAAKRAQHSLDFGDLLLGWWQLMRHPVLAGRVRARFDHVLVDEVQDVNALQADLVQALRPQGAGLTAVGDDAQAIYGFRGGDARHVLELPARFDPPARVLVLTRNHRSTQPLLDASNALMEGVARRFEKRLWSTRRDGPRPRLVVADDELAQARGVADAVLAEREGGLALRRQAVLFRTGTHSLALELELTRRNVPFVKYGGLRFLEAAHVKDLLAVLRWADNPASSLAALRCAKLVPGLGPAGARRLAERPADLAAFVPPPSARAGWAAFRALLEGLRDAGSRWPGELRGVLDWYRPQAERLFDDARVRLAELEQLAVLAARQTSRERFVTELALDPPAAAGDEAGAPHRDDDWLVLSTIHSAKGQEWSAVHVLHVVDGCLPADMATGSAAEIDEERRLLYVAMTRARDRLWMWLPQRFHVTQQRALGDRHLFAPPSRFLTPAVRGCCDEVASGAAPEAEARPAIDTAPLLDLGHALRRGWRA